MNDRYIIKCIATKEITPCNKVDSTINVGDELWYNPEAQTFWRSGDRDLLKAFYPSQEWPRQYLPVTKIQNNAKIFKKLATAKSHVKNIENSNCFKCEIYKLITTIEKVNQ